MKSISLSHEDLRVIRAYVDYIERQQYEADRLKDISSQVRKGAITPEQAKQRVRSLCKDPAVHDGDRLYRVCQKILRRAS